LQLGIVDPLVDFPELQMALVEENEIEFGDFAPCQGLLGANLNWRGCVCQVVLALNDADMSNSRLFEGPDGLCNDIETGPGFHRHQGLHRFERCMWSDGPTEEGSWRLLPLSGSRHLLAKAGAGKSDAKPAAKTFAGAAES
jgi:hypothetical protein